MKRLLTILILLAPMLALQAGHQQDATKKIKYKKGPAFIYRVTLADKQGTPYSLEHPSRYLSRRSIERRRRQGLPLDSTDLPVSSHYLRQIEKTAVSIVGQSRWQNSVLVRTKDTTIVSQLRQLPFVKACKLVWQAPDSITPLIKQKYHEQFEEHDSVTGELYGTAADQIRSVMGHRLHDIGMRGEGMMIAVIDGGFRHVDRIPAFQHIDIRGWRDFVNPEAPTLFYDTDHGTRVLSAMAINKPYYYIGTAPHAAYWVLRSEDQQTEQEVEEDYWTMAAEFADSVGCDLINSSLGYNEYDNAQTSYQHARRPCWPPRVSSSSTRLATTAWGPGRRLPSLPMPTTS